MSKKISTILFLVICLTSVTSYSQDFERLSQKEFKTPEDYKYAESQVLKCSEYLINNPGDLDTLNRLYAVLYITKWMTGTPDHRIILNVSIMNLGKEYTDFQSIYVASLVKYTLDIKHADLTAIERSKAANNQLLMHCSNPENKISFPQGLKL